MTQPHIEFEEGVGKTEMFNGWLDTLNDQQRQQIKFEFEYEHKRAPENDEELYDWLLQTEWSFKYDTYLLEQYNDSGDWEATLDSYRH